MAQLNKLIFWTYLILMSLGLLFVTNSSIVKAFRESGNQWHYLIKQTVWICLSLTSYIIIIRQLPVKIYSYSKTYYWLIIALLSLIIVPGISQQVQGAKRWFDFGFFSLQPSEFAKGALVLYLPVLAMIKKVPPTTFLTLGFLPVFLTLLQPDLGTAIVMTVVILGIYLLAKYPLAILVKHLPLALIFLTIYILISPYRQARLKTYLSLSHDPQGNSYQTRQSLLAIGSGGIFGVGLGQSRQKFNFLPESNTDSIFSIIAEETGLFGVSIIIILFVTLISAIFRISGIPNQPLSSLTIQSVGLLIATQSLLNLTAITGIVPLTGVPLPFISYGGSSLLNFSLCLALVTAISRHAK